MRERSTNTRIKEHSTSFYLSADMLEELDRVAEFHNVSRSAVVQRIIDFIRKGGDYESWEKSKAAYKNRKEKKKILSFKKCKQSYRKRGKDTEAKQECLFNPMYSKWY